MLNPTESPPSGEDPAAGEPVKPETLDEHAVEATDELTSLPNIRDLCDTRSDYIELIQAFVRPLREGEDTLLAAMTDDQLDELLSSYASAYRAVCPNGLKASVDEFIATVEATPSHRARADLARKGASHLVAMAQKAERVFGGGAVTNLFTNGTVIQTYTDAIQAVDLVTTALRELGVLMGRHKPSEVHPISLREALANIKMAGIQITVADKFRTNCEKVIAELRARADNLEGRLNTSATSLAELRSSYFKDLEASVLIPEDMPKTFLVSSGEEVPRFLCRRNKKNDRLGKKFRLDEFYWSTSYANAVKFSSRADMSAFVDKLVKREANHLRKTGEVMRLRKVPLIGVKFVQLGIILR